MEISSEYGNLVNIWNPACINDDELSVDALKLDSPADNCDQDPRVNDIGEYTLEILIWRLTSLSVSVKPSARSMRFLKLYWISWNVALINAPFPRLLPTLRLFVSPSVDCLSSASRKRSKSLHSSRGMHHAILFASTTRVIRRCWRPPLLQGASWERCQMYELEMQNGSYDPFHSWHTDS